MSPLKGNCKVLFKITLFKKKKTTLPRSPAINQLYVQAPNLQTHLRANYLQCSFPLAHLPSPSDSISGITCQEPVVLRVRPCLDPGEAPGRGRGRAESGG